MIYHTLGVNMGLNDGYIIHCTMCNKKAPVRGLFKVRADVAVNMTQPHILLLASCVYLRMNRFLI